VENQIEKTIVEKLRSADQEVHRTALAYRKAKSRRATIYSAAAEILSQKQVADLTGITQQRVSQIVKDARPETSKRTRAVIKRLMPDA
jgi:hypothetical protein